MNRSEAAADTAMKGTDMSYQFNETVDVNTKIIKTLPLEISQDVVNHVSSKTFEGMRADEIAKEIKEYFPQHTKAKERLIARTEAAKCKSALTQARSEEIGVYWAIWKTVGDSVVRSSHDIMDNVICNYNHPPSPEDLARKAGIYNGKSYGKYLAGEIFNCRCYMAPLISYSQVKFPVKVYNWKTERIETMTKEQFEEFGGKEAD